MTIRTEMPLLARHEGTWQGQYVHVDAQGREIDRHDSILDCRFPADGPYAYAQTNTYVWADGRRESFEFPARYDNRRIWFDTDRIVGYAFEVDERTIVLTWRRKDLEGSTLYEMIQLSSCGRHRARTWHWFEDEVLVRRTLITETRIG